MEDHVCAQLCSGTLKQPKSLKFVNMCFVTYFKVIEGSNFTEFKKTIQSYIKVLRKFLLLLSSALTVPVLCSWIKKGLANGIVICVYIIGTLDFTIR